MKNKRLLLSFITIITIAMVSNVCAQDVIRIGVAWTPSVNNNDRVMQAIKLGGGEPVILEQVRPNTFEYDSITLSSKYVDEYNVLLEDYATQIKNNTWHNSNVESVMKDIDAVVFLGGGDISSTLFREPQPWHCLPDDKCNATRDLSEYITMSYCLDNDIPVLGLCRGMQMLAVVSGASMIQDLDTYYKNLGIEYNNLHRSLRDSDGNRHYLTHDVAITNHASLLYNINLVDTIKNVPSWHHQVVGDIKGTNLIISGITTTQGVDIIEAIERKDKTFALGVQFHPEEAVKKQLLNTEDDPNFMQLNEGVNYFRTLVNYCKRMKSSNN